MQTYLYYFASLESFFQKKVLDGKMENKYQKYFKELKRTKVKE